MKKIFIATFLLFMICVESGATPSPAVHIRTIFLGYSEDHYFCLENRRNHPGSYYEYTEYLSLLKFNLDGWLVEKTLLEETHFWLPGADPDKQWEQKHKNVSKLKVGEYMVRHDIRLAFPAENPWPDGVRAVLNKDGVWLERKDKTSLLIVGEDLKKQAPGYEGFAESDFDFSLTEIYESPTHYFIIVDIGGCCSDQDLYISVVPVQRHRVKRAVSQISDEKKK